MFYHRLPVDERGVIITRVPDVQKEIEGLRRARAWSGELRAMPPATIKLVKTDRIVCYGFEIIFQ